MSTIAPDQLGMDDLVACAVEVLADGHVSFGELVFLGGKLAGKASQLAHLSGKEKEQLVLKVVEVALHQVLKEKKKTLSAEEFSAFFDKTEVAKEFVRETLPAVLAVVVQASKGQLDFQKATKTGWNVLRYLCTCWGVRLPEEPKLTPVVAIQDEPASEKKTEKEPEPVVEADLPKVEVAVVRQETMIQLPQQPDEETKSEEAPSKVEEQEVVPQEDAKVQE